MPLERLATGAERTCGLPTAADAYGFRVDDSRARRQNGTVLRLSRNPSPLAALTATAVLFLAFAGGQAATAESVPAVSTCVAAWNDKSNHLRPLITPRTRIGVVAPFFLSGGSTQNRSGCEFTFFGPKYSVLVDAYSSEGGLRWGRAFAGRDKIGDAAPNVRVTASGSVVRIR
jgi:hypothetical protein